ncbi:MAG: hypothetical protein ACKO41_02460 [Sphingomonadales bacterium]
MKANSFLSIQTLIIGFFILFLNLSVEAQKRKSATDLRQDLLKTEQARPKTYISINSYSWSVNLASNTVLKGVLQNSATLAWYRNVKIRARFYTQNGTYISGSEHIFTVLKDFPPSKLVDFRSTISGYWKDAKKISFEIISVENF